MNPGLGGSTPQINAGAMQPGQKALFHSLRDIALIKDKTIRAGFGVVKAGTVMAVDDKTSDLVPVAPTAVSIDDTQRVFLLASVSVAAVVYVPLEKSYRFAVGDTVIIGDNTPAYTDGGAITAIDRTTYADMAEITFTNNATATLANQANIYHKAGSSGRYSTAVWINDQDVFTGEGEDAAGANTSVVISNAILYSAALIGHDSASATSLGTTTDGEHVILK